MRYYVKRGFYQFTEVDIIEDSDFMDNIEGKLQADSEEMFRDQNDELDWDEEAEGEYEDTLVEEIEVSIEEYDENNSTHTSTLEYKTTPITDYDNSRFK